MSALFSRRPAAVTMNVRQRAQDALSALNLHFAGLALVGLVNLYLLVHVVILYQQAKGQDAEALSRQQVALKTAQIAAQPLQGLDVKLQKANTQADTFYDERLPVSYSEIAQEVGVLATDTKVRLAGAQYSQNAVTGDAAGQLTQVTLDARLTGSYRPLVEFINRLERSKVFFLISGVTLTGQQSGTVNLRVRITTYIRGMASAADGAKVAVGFDVAPGAPTGAGAGGAR